MSSGTGILVLGHRGASATHPENTLAAFREAVAQGADGVELDVRLNAAGELIVHHDAWYRDGRTLWDVPLSAAPFGTCDLTAALDACSGLLVNVEVKNSPGDLGGDHVRHSVDVADAVVDLLDAREWVDRVIVSSFDALTLERIVERSADLPTGFLIADPRSRESIIEEIADRGHQAVHPWDPCVDADLVDRCAAVGLSVNTWTVNDGARAVELASFGVDAVITDAPDRILAAVRPGRPGHRGGSRPA